MISVAKTWKGASAMRKGALPETSDPLNYAKMKYVLKEMQLPIRKKK